ncbi:unnamed protein product [Hermetia illucens]|uniref:Uncharacterized protein n=1 Tax=Hermetia illucens TaxID=343691 RepID=A0A7R8YRJ7_HERIL|nr:unnamed protein product [Hermetia illucens]
MEAGGSGGGICARFFHFVYRQKKYEQLMFAVEKLVNTVMFEAMIKDYPARYKVPLSVPFAAPNSTPEETNTRNFFLYRDLLILSKQKNMPDFERQTFIHEEMVKTENYSKVRKFVKRWMNKANVKKRSLIWEQQFENKIIYERDGVIAAASDVLKIDGLKRINKANNEIVIIRGSTCTAGDLSSQCRSKSKSKLSVSFKDNSKSELGNRDLSNLGKTAKLDSVNAVETKLGSGSKSVLGNSDNLDLGDVNKSDLGGANNSRLRITAESDFGSPVKLKFESKAKTDLGNANNSNFENGIKSDLGSVAKSEYRSLFSIRTAQSHYMDAIEDSGDDQSNTDENEQIHRDKDVSKKKSESRRP